MNLYAQAILTVRLGGWVVPGTSLDVVAKSKIFAPARKEILFP
jgi:hypothetical protein